MVSTLAITDALAKLMIAKGIITDEEFKGQLGRERANYLAVLKRLTEKLRVDALGPHSSTAIESRSARKPSVFGYL